LAGWRGVFDRLRSQSRIVNLSARAPAPAASFDRSRLGEEVDDDVARRHGHSGTPDRGVDMAVIGARFDMVTLSRNRRGQEAAPPRSVVIGADDPRVEHQPRQAEDRGSRDRSQHAGRRLCQHLFRRLRRQVSRRIEVRAWHEQVPPAVLDLGVTRRIAEAVATVEAGVVGRGWQDRRRTQRWQRLRIEESMTFASEYLL
jgi:hypothetical protein